MGARKLQGYEITNNSLTNRGWLPGKGSAPPTQPLLTPFPAGGSQIAFVIWTHPESTVVHHSRTKVGNFYRVIGRMAVGRTGGSLEGRSHQGTSRIKFVLESPPVIMSALAWRSSASHQPHRAFPIPTNS
ncbi:unnamed protein product [Nesidiocoris tenuis]|uniref:Uncharacterized protein n=1 Tax=Nesidiocoris tenuis TaxID=355587 RepID=A0A6H5HIY8_9HEMI|nr:unnamed protein product [Nesidiocoris tenuis]